MRVGDVRKHATATWIREYEGYLHNSKANCLDKIDGAGNLFLAVVRALLDENVDL